MKNEENKYIKNFDEWNEVKKKVDINKKKIFFKDREIWWLSVGINVGFEIDGKNNLFERPVLVVKKINKNQFWGIPLTSKDKKGFFYIKGKFSNKQETSPIVLSQFKMFSSKRLLRKLGTIDKVSYVKIKNKISDFLFQEHDN